MEYSFQNINKEAFFTQECLYRKKTNTEPFVIGIPKENVQIEPRLSFTPEGVQILVNAGYEVIVESDAGRGINYSNQDFSEAGAFITDNKALVYQADMLFKIAPFSLEEALLLKERITVFSMLQLQDLSIETIRILQHKKINAIAYDFLKDEQQNYSVVNSIREIEGKVAISVAAEMMSSQHGGKGILLGGIAGVNPSEIIILGAGISGTAAAQVALSLGSVVKVFDHDVSKLRDLHRFLGTSVCSSVFHPLSLSKALLSADAVIGCLRYEEEFRHFLVLEEAVQTMKKGAVIVDLAMNQGGCFETSVCTSLNKPYFMRHGVLHCCVPNLSARVARTSSMALSDVLSELMLSVNQDGGIVNSIKKNQGFSSGVYLYNGILTNAFIGSHLGLLSNDIRLLLAAF